MAAIVVIAPVGGPDLGGDTSIVRYATVSDAVAALAAQGDVVLVTDSLSDSDLAQVAEAVRSRSGQTIEVRSERWDGETPSPLSAACRGVISGFGMAGVARAIEVLRGG